MAFTYGENGMINLDQEQVTRYQASDDGSGGLAQKTLLVGGNLVPEKYDNMDLTYVAAGPGTGEIETVTYKLGVTTIATLTLSYDGSNRLSSVVRS